MAVQVQWDRSCEADLVDLWGAAPGGHQQQKKNQTKDTFLLGGGWMWV